jgi:Glycosyl hydrolase family 26
VSVPLHRISAPSRLLLALVVAVTLVAPACDLIIVPNDPPATPPPRDGDDPSDTDPPTPGQDTSKPAVPEVGALAGAYVHPRPEPVKAVEQALWSRREADAGRTYDIGHTFYSFAKPFPTWREAWHASEGRTPMVSWGQASTSQVADGSYDELIRTRARALRDLDTPVFLRWMAEMDGHAKAPLAESPAKFTAAWRHMHDIFEQEGAENVAFVWCPNSWTYDISPALASLWYPGGDTVDWVCADGYNWAPANGSWTSFQQVFTGFYDWAVTTGKPIMIGEFGALERGPGEKAAWIRAIGPTLRDAFPAVKAIVYFDENKSENGATYDWRLDATADSYQAWNDLINDPYLDTRR